VPASDANPALPRHVAIVMDGNGRWARKRGMPRELGHRQGQQAAKRIVRRCGELGIQVLTLFAFSSENWRRPAGEVGMLMSLLLESLQSEVRELHQQGVQLRFIGDRAAFAPELQARMQAAEAMTRGNGGLILVIALGYGGRWDLVQAARRVATEARDGTLDPAQIDEAAFAQRLALAGVPEPDLFIRTGGEQRISNFLLWDLAYTELWFSAALWPDFDAAAFDGALDWYASRERRFGGVTETAKDAVS
jgi:undecaprenyl diphosphate synthase